MTPAADDDVNITVMLLQSTCMISGVCRYHCVKPSLYQNQVLKVYKKIA